MPGVSEKHARVTGERYYDFVDKFVNIAHEVFPDVYIHFEDFGRNIIFLPPAAFSRLAFTSFGLSIERKAAPCGFMKISLYFSIAAFKWQTHIIF